MLLLYLVLAIVVALVGGALPAIVAVLGGFVLANWYFTPPFYGLHISDVENVLALVVYAVSAGIVAVLVDRVGRSRIRAARAQAEAEALASLAGSMARPGSLGEMLGELRSTFGFRGAALLRREDGGWVVVTSSGVEAPEQPDGADVSRDLGRGITLALAGGELSVGDQRVLNAFAAQVAVAAETERLQGEAGKASELAAANTLRASLLQAVSHDLRTPLAAIKASISSLRQADVAWSPEDVEEFQTTIESETDRLSELVGNLLDMSRLQASALTVDLRPTGIEETVLGRRGQPGDRRARSSSTSPRPCPRWRPTRALLERALANLVGNAVRFSPDTVPARITAGAVTRDGRALRGHPRHRSWPRHPAGRPEMRCSNRSSDWSTTRPTGPASGSGLAIARGFVEAMGGELAIDDTPGGGVTMVVSLPTVGQAGYR